MRPAPAMLGRRTLHIYWLIETSGGMDGAYIEAVNRAFREVAEFVQEYATNFTRNDILVHALQYDDGARWVSEDFRKGIAARDFSWSIDLAGKGMTDLGCALEMLSEELRALPANSFTPVLCLLLALGPSDRFVHGMQALFDTGWGKHALRIAIAIGDDADTQSIKYFCANNPMLREYQPSELMLHATSSVQVAESIRWAFEVAMKFPLADLSERRESETDEWIN